jgi:hypothetical protein
MKKVITIAMMLTLLFAVSNLFAQAPTTGITGKGVKLGLNLAKFTGADADNEKMLTGVAFGGFITYSFNDLFAIQPEVYYTMKGSKTTVTYLNTDYDVTNKFNYIEIPVLFRVQLAGGTSFKPNFYAGPELGILMSAKSKVKGGSEIDLKDDVKSTDIGIIGGVGAEYPMGSGKLLLDIRYDAGLSKLDDTPAKGDYKNSAITILVGYGF